MRVNNEKGVALVFTLLAVVVLLTLGGVFVLRTINEWNTALRERSLTQAFYISEAGSDAGIDRLDALINTYMLNTISNVNPSTLIATTQSYVSSGDGIGFLLTSVLNGGSPQLTQVGNDAVHQVGPVGIGGGTYSFDIKIAEKDDPYSSGPDEWEFPFYFRVESTGNMGGQLRKVLLVGDFTVQVQRDNFAKYALFTNHQNLPPDDPVYPSYPVWFTDKTNFAGPLHTNDRYNFALNPSGTFEGNVDQDEQDARFYNGGVPVLLDADFNGTDDVPTFNAGFDRGIEEIALSSSVQKQDIIDQATANNTYSSDGIYIPNNGTSLTGGIYIHGDASVDLNVDVNDNAVYTVAQGGTTKIITVDRLNNQTSINTVGLGTETFSGYPDGVDDVGTLVFVNGNITSLGGTVQRDTELTISSENDISITNHLTYEDYTPAVGTPGQPGYVPPSAAGATNLLGLVTWEGDLRVDTTAPDNINVHGTLLAQNGIFQVDNYWDQGVGSRGTATLLGGIISDYYGAFGLFNGSTGQQVSGYGRNFIYDDRMLLGNAPPYFPSLNTFIAFTNDIIDKVTQQEGGF